MKIEKLIDKKAKIEDEKMDVLEKTLQGIIGICDRLDKIENDISILKKLVSSENKVNEYQDKEIQYIQNKIEEILTILTKPCLVPITCTLDEPCIKK